MCLAGSGILSLLPLLLCGIVVSVDNTAGQCSGTIVLFVANNDHYDGPLHHLFPIASSTYALARVIILKSQNLGGGSELQEMYRY